MNNLNIASFQNAFNSIKNTAISKISEWRGYIVVKLQSGIPYLQEPRLASSAVLLVNFLILELAIRISQFVGFCLPQKTVTEKNIKTAFEFTLAGALILGANVAFIKTTKISLNPFVVTAIVILTFIIKINLQRYIEFRQIEETEEF